MAQSKSQPIAYTDRSDLIQRILGISLIAGSAAAFGTLAIFGRYAYTAGMDAVTILFLRCFYALRWRRWCFLCFCSFVGSRCPVADQWRRWWVWVRLAMWGRRSAI
jgi:hypothetical protein